MSAVVPQVLMECLGWTLIHFVWQGLVIAIVLAVVLRGLRKGSPNRRYVAGCVALLGMAVTPLITLQILSPGFALPAATIAIEARPIFHAAAASLAPPIDPIERELVISRRAAAKQLPWRMEACLPGLVAGWLAGVLALSCRLAAGWLQIQRLRRNARILANGDWGARMVVLSERIGIRRSVRLLQSVRIDVPMVIGWLRPVVILPASCLTGLTTAQLESILAHELAHVRRHDYLINLLQSLLETLLFYHPAVWWVSRRVRAERENCCDDLAVGICGNRLEYARALATLEELRPASAPLAVAAGGAPLLNRIRRLAGKPEVNTDRLSGWAHAGVIALITIALLAIDFRATHASAAERTAGTVKSAPIDLPNPLRPAIGMFQFHVTPNSLLDALKQALGEPPDESTAPAGGATPVAGLDGLLTRYLETLGVEFRPSNPANTSGRYLVLDERTGVLFINAPLNDVDTVTRALKNLTAKLPQTPSGPGAGSWNGSGEAGISAPTRLGEFWPDLFPLPNPLAAVVQKTQSADETLVPPQDKGSNSPPRNVQPEPDVKSWVKTNSVHTSPGRAVIISKLNHIHLDMTGGVIDNLPLREVLAFFREQCQLGDPEHKGINFFLDGKSLGSPNLESTTGRLAPPPDDPNDVGDVKVSVSLKKTSLTSLKDALDEIVRTADRPIKFSILDNGVSVSFKRLEDTNPMQTRVFRVETNAFTLALERWAAEHPVPGSAGGDPNIQTFTRLREFLTSSGIDFATNNPSNAGKTIFYGDRKAMLIVHAPAADLDAITRALETLTPPSLISDTGNWDRGALAANARQTSTTSASPPVVQDVTTGVSERDGPRQPDGKSWVKTNSVHTSPGRALITSKLDQIRLSSVVFDGQPLREMINRLHEETKLHDPSHQGINFFVDRMPVGAAADRQLIDPNTGTPITTLPTADQGEVGDVKVAILLTNASLNEVLEAMTRTADRPIKISILDYGVAFSLKGPEDAVPMETRVFHVNPNSFRAGLESIVGVSNGSVITTGDVPANGSAPVPYLGNAAAGGVRSTNLTHILDTMVRQYFTAAGIDFNTNNAANVGKTIFFNDRKGLLIVHAPAADLDLIAVALDALNEAPPEYNVKFKLVEIDEPVSGTTNFDWLFADSGIQYLTNALSTNLNAEIFTRLVTSNSVQMPTTELTNLGMSSITGLLSREQLGVVIKKLEQHAGVDLMTAPEITTESGRRAQVQAVEMVNIVTMTNTVSPNASDGSGEFDTHQIPIGPVIDVIPTRFGNGDQVALKLEATITGFLGYDDPRATNGANPRAGTNFTATLQPLPRLHIRQMTTDVMIGDGQTIVLGGTTSDETVTMKSKVPVLGDVPLIGKLFRNSNSHTTRKSLLVFATVTRVNPDGSRYNPLDGGKR